MSSEDQTNDDNVSDQLEWLQQGIPDDVWIPLCKLAQQHMESRTGLRSYAKDKKSIKSTKYICVTCKELYNDPVLLPTCGHLICKHHLTNEGSINRAIECHRCNTVSTWETEEVSLHQKTIDRVSNVGILCPLCDADTTVGGLQLHVRNACDFLPCMCKFEKCEAQLVRCATPLHNMFCTHNANATPIHQMSNANMQTLGRIYQTFGRGELNKVIGTQYVSLSAAKEEDEPIYQALQITWICSDATCRNVNLSEMTHCVRCDRVKPQ